MHLMFKLKRCVRMFFETSFLKTLYFNFRVLPFRQAVHVPIYLYPRVELVGIYRGCIRFVDEKNIYGGMISIGYNKYPVTPSKKTYTLLRFETKGKLLLGSEVVIKNGCVICVYKKAVLEIGKNFYCNSNTSIYSKSSVLIGDNCSFGWNCQIYDSNFHFMYDESKHSISKCHGNVVIGNNVWIANSCVVSKNAVIPPFSVVANGTRSLVNKNFSSIESFGNVFAGVPAKVVATGKTMIKNLKFEHFLLKYFDEHENENEYFLEKKENSWFEN